jgi:hypothetical protein
MLGYDRKASQLFHREDAMSRSFEILYRFQRLPLFVRWSVTYWTALTQ